MSVYHVAVSLPSCWSHARQTWQQAGQGDLIGSGAGTQGGRGLVGLSTEVSIPGGMDTLGVIRPGLVHLLHIGTRGTGQVGLIDSWL